MVERNASVWDFPSCPHILDVETHRFPSRRRSRSEGSEFMRRIRINALISFTDTQIKFYETRGGAEKDSSARFNRHECTSILLPDQCSPIKAAHSSLTKLVYFSCDQVTLNGGRQGALSAASWSRVAGASLHIYRLHLLESPCCRFRLVLWLFLCGMTSSLSISPDVQVSVCVRVCVHHGVSSST